VLKFKRKFWRQRVKSEIGMSFGKEMCGKMWH